MRKIESKGTRTQKRIIDSAIRLFAIHGFAETSFQMIADECGVTHSTALYHFKSKTGLIREVIEEITAHNHDYVDSRIDRSLGGKDTLREHIYWNTQWAVEFRSHVQVLLLLYYYAFMNPELKELHLKYIRVAKERALHYILAGQREGTLISSDDPKMMIDVFYNFKLGLFIHAIEHENHEDPTGSFMKVWDTLLEKFTVGTQPKDS